MTTLPNEYDPAPPPADELYAGMDGILEGDALDAEVATVQQGGDGAWQIDNANQAEWAMAKLAEAQRQEAELLAARDAQMERAQAWYARTVRRSQRTAGFMQAQLIDYALRQREAGKGATLVLPNGEVPTRKAPDPCVVIDDVDALVAWALKAAPSIVDTTHKVLVTNLRSIASATGGKAVRTETGEVIPGAGVSDSGEPTATVKPY